MPAAIALIVAGFVFVYSALKGLTLPEVLGGMTGVKLDARGGNARTGGGTSVTGAAAADAIAGADPEGVFKGPNAKLLRYVTDVGKKQYHLRVSQICRPQNASYGAPNSLHKECRAVDMVGAVSDRVAWARWIHSSYPVLEVFCDQAGLSAPGYDHSDHAHAGG